MGTPGCLFGSLDVVVLWLVDSWWEGDYWLADFGRSDGTLWFLRWSSVGRLSMGDGGRSPSWWDQRWRAMCGLKLQKVSKTRGVSGVDLEFQVL